MATGPGHTCYICDLLRQESAPTMVWYDKMKRWLCLRCHLAERKLQKFKGKGTVQRVFQKCDVCKDSSHLQNENMASWFCYDCRHYLCKLCVKSKEQCPHNNKVTIQGADVHPGQGDSGTEIQTAFESLPKAHFCNATKPSPGHEFAEYHFVQEICIDKAPMHNENTIKIIAKWMTALMNNSGGLIVLYSNNPYSDNERDKWVMGLESVLINNWIPESTFQSLVRCQYLELDGQLRIYMFICKCSHMLTFTYNAYGRRATGIIPIKEASRVKELLQQSYNGHDEDGCISAVKQLTKHTPLQFKAPIPITHRESQTLEYKHCYSDASKKIELPSFDARKLITKLSNYFTYFSAFANTHGGSLVLGVEEGGVIPVIRGFQVVENQQDEEIRIINYVYQKLKKCIWHANPDYQPCMGNDWNIFFYDVIQDGNPKRKVIEICIPKHRGGMFLRSPIYYKVSDNGQDLVSNIEHDEEKSKQKKSFEDWKKRFYAETTKSQKTDGSDYLKQHMKHGGLTAEAASSLKTAMGTAVPTTENPSNEMKLPKSFKESQSEYKSGIEILGLSLKDCCTEKMATFIKSLSNTKAWYPPSDIMRNRCIDDGCYKKAIEFVDAKNWNGVAGVIDFAIESVSESVDSSLPMDNCRLVCRVLIARKSEPPTLVHFIEDRSTAEVPQESTTKLVEYALTDARKVKKEFLESTVYMSHQSQLFHFDVEVVLIRGEGETKTVWDSTWEKSQPVAYPASVDNEIQYDIACNGLAVRLLKTRSAVKDRYGEILIEHLTEAQARILSEKNERVLIVSGKSGTGKTVIALHLVCDAIRHVCADQHVLYICSSEGLRAFISSQVRCRTVVVEKTDGLSREIKSCIQEAKLVIVDDLHAIKLGNNWAKDPLDLYRLLFARASKGACEVAIFFDEEQDFKNQLPSGFDKRLRDVAEETEGMLPEHIKIVTLNDRIRNSREINHFMQANQNQAQIPGVISCLNELRGDDVFYEDIGDHADRAVKIINEKLLAMEKRYSAKSIAILCEESILLHKIKAKLEGKFGRTFQDDMAYPIKNTVMCQFDDFMGQEADVVLFLFSETFGIEKSNVHWKLINFISSRAKLRLEFLLLRKSVKSKATNMFHKLCLGVLAPRKPSGKKENKLTHLLGLFNTPLIDYPRLEEVGRNNLMEQGLGELQGLCYFDGKLFVVWSHAGGCKMDVYTAYYDEDTGVTINHLDSMKLPGECIRSPCIDRHGHSIFIACVVGGVVIARLEGDRLVTEKTLRCVEKPHDVDVVSPDTICVCDGDTYTVKVVDVTHDVVTATLLRPEEVIMNGTGPMRLAVLGNCIMEMHGKTLIIYHYDNIKPIEIIRVPESLNSVSAISTDGRGHFLLTDCETRAVFVVDMKGELRHRVDIQSDYKTCDCAVVGRQLWVGCSEGDIVFLSSTNPYTTSASSAEMVYGFSSPCHLSSIKSSPSYLPSIKSLRPVDILPESSISTISFN